MTNIYKIASCALASLQERLSANAMNAANATTPGYRRRLNAQLPQFSALLASPNLPITTKTEQSAGFVSSTTVGQLRKTNGPTDVALTTPDAFFLLSDGTRKFISRAGNFHIDAEGFLASPTGHRVQSANGDILLPPGRVTIDNLGQVSVDGRVASRIAVVSVSDLAKISFLENGIEAPADALSLRSNDSYTVRAGYVEDSNGDQTSDMLALMATVRQYESVIRATQGYDDMLARSIQKLGDIQG